jgi:hypothetical protein
VEIDFLSRQAQNSDRKSKYSRKEQIFLVIGVIVQIKFEEFQADISDKTYAKLKTKDKRRDGVGESVAGSGGIDASIGDRASTRRSVDRPADIRGGKESAAVRRRSGRCCSATSPGFSPPEAVPSRPGARGHPRAHRRGTIIPLRTVHPWSR